MGSLVLLTVDCLRADHVGCYGYDRPTTPNVDAFAGDEATVFENAYANCPGTRWAFQTLHTGLWTSQIDGLGIPDPDSTPVLAETLREGGYATGGFANNGYVSRDYGYDRGFDTFRGVTDFTDEHSAFDSAVRRVDDLLTRSPLEPYVSKLYGAFERFVGGDFEPAVTDEDVCDVAIEWIAERRAAGEDYFAWIHLMDAHTPYARRDDLLAEIRGDADVDHVIHPGRSDIGEVGTEPPERLIDTYDTGVRSADEQIGRVLDAVGEDATVVVTGDHGEEFGRYGEFHVASLHDSFTQVPLIVRADGLPAGERVEGPAQHVDVPATLLFDAGIEVPDHWPGRPLQDHDDGSLDDPIFFEIDGSAGVREGDWKLIAPVESGEIAGAEATDLYRAAHMSPDGEPVADDERTRELLGLLADHRAGLRQVSTTGRREHEDISEEVEDNLADLGYIE